MTSTSPNTQTVHRAALQKSLVRGALDTGHVKLMTDQIITEYDFDKTRLLVRNEDTDEDEWVQADLLICADGIKSRARAAIYKRLGIADSGE